MNAKRVLDRGLMGPFDHSGHRRVGDRPQASDTDFTGENVRS